MRPKAMQEAAIKNITTITVPLRFGVVMNSEMLPLMQYDFQRLFLKKRIQIFFKLTDLLFFFIR